MTTRRKVITFGGLLAACALALLLILPRTPPPAARTQGTPSAEPSTAQVNLDENLAQASTAERTQIESTSPASPTTGSLIVTVVYAKGSLDSSPARDIGLDVRPSGYRNPVPGPIRVRTDEAGVVRLEGLNPGTCRVQTNHWERSTTVEITAGEETTMTIQLKMGVNLRGIVVDQDDIPVPSAGIVLAPLGALRTITARAATTGPDGRFFIRAVARFCGVGARAPSHAASAMYLVNSTDGSDVDLRIVLPAGTRSRPLAASHREATR
jgi:hypothetical protein